MVNLLRSTLPFPDLFRQKYEKCVYLAFDKANESISSKYVNQLKSNPNELFEFIAEVYNELFKRKIKFISATHFDYTGEGIDTISLIARVK